MVRRTKSQPYFQANLNALVEPRISYPRPVPEHRAQQARWATLAQRLDQLAERSLAPWLDVGLDPEGGAFGFLDRYFVPRFHRPGDPRGPSGERRGDQSLVQQSRHLYSYSLAHQRRPGDPRLVALARALFEHLVGSFSRVAGEEIALASQTSSTTPPPSSTRPAIRPLLHWVPRGGLPPWEAASDQGDFEIEDPKSPLCTQLYAQGFAVYAFSTYALAFDQPDAARRALDLFRLLDRHRHDDEFGGYDQTLDGGWMPFVDAPRGAAKCTNTHIHLLEALTPLCRAFPEDDLVAERLLELSRYISGRMLQPSGYVHKFFARDGSPLGAPEVSYGHDLETSWLLVDALDALEFAGRLDASTKASVEDAATRMASHALRTGWDPAGGVFDVGVPEGQAEPPRVTGYEKIWWAQAETLPGLFRLHQRTRDPGLLDRMEETLEFLATKSFDPEGGEFFWGVDSKGNCLGRGDHKGEMWKTPYHALRACLLTADWIRQDLAFVRE